MLRSLQVRKTTNSISSVKHQFLKWAFIRQRSPQNVIKTTRFEILDIKTHSNNLSLQEAN